MALSRKRPRSWRRGDNHRRDRDHKTRAGANDARTRAMAAERRGSTECPRRRAANMRWPTASATTREAPCTLHRRASDHVVAARETLTGATVRSQDPSQWTGARMRATAAGEGRLSPGGKTRTVPLARGQRGDARSAVHLALTRKRPRPWRRATPHCRRYDERGARRATAREAQADTQAPRRASDRWDLRMSRGLWGAV